MFCKRTYKMARCVVNVSVCVGVEDMVCEYGCDRERVGVGVGVDDVQGVWHK